MSSTLRLVVAVFAGLVAFGTTYAEGSDPIELGQFMAKNFGLTVETMGVLSILCPANQSVRPDMRTGVIQVCYGSDGRISGSLFVKDSRLRAEPFRNGFLKRYAAIIANSDLADLRCVGQKAQTTLSVDIEDCAFTVSGKRYLVSFAYFWHRGNDMVLTIGDSPTKDVSTVNSVSEDLRVLVSKLKTT